MPVRKDRSKTGIVFGDNGSRVKDAAYLAAFAVIGAGCPVI